MYCKNCGQQIDDKATYCPYCGTVIVATDTVSVQDAPSTGFAVVGFFLGLFIPFIGLILFLAYYNKYPQRAKSVGKGTLTGFLTNVVLAVIVISVAVYFSTISNSKDEILTKYAHVTFGEFKVTNSYGVHDTSLDVMVKNISNNRYSFHIQVEAVDKDGVRIDTDTVFANLLNPSQTIVLQAFKYVFDDNKIEKLKTATFKVLDISYSTY